MKKKVIFFVCFVIVVLLCVAAFLFAQGRKPEEQGTEKFETASDVTNFVVGESEAKEDNIEEEEPFEKEEEDTKIDLVEGEDVTVTDTPSGQEQCLPKEDVSEQEETPSKEENPFKEEDVTESKEPEREEVPADDENEEEQSEDAEPEEESLENLPQMLFIHAEGERLVDEEGNAFRIKGMCFGNNVWQNPDIPTVTHHDRESYKELSELGFNTVRFYLNYRLFEEDEAPYVYKEEAFGWLDQNIRWAHENNIRLVLNLHVPQGGFLSAKNVQFWKDEENISRYTALWHEIATRYADEPVILGYGLMNEPFLPESGSADTTLALYYGLMEELVSVIRKADENHMFFVERPYGTVDAAGNVNYAWGDVGSFQRISDENTVYEFHFYEYTNFTSQGISWSSFEKDWYYGDDSIALLSGKRDYCDVCKEKSIKEYDIWRGGWQLVESPMYDISEYKAADVAYFVLYFSQLNKNAAVSIDDIVVKEYDSTGQFVREVYTYSFDSVTECSGWDFGTGNGGRCVYVQSAGHESPGCEMILDARGDYRLYKNESIYNYFPIKEGNRYQVSCWIKVEGWAPVVIQPSMQLVEVEKVFALNKEFLRNKLNLYRELGQEHNVPIYIGEFGVTSHIMGNEFGGEKWVEDVFDILNEFSMNYSYHDYHEENYGFYTTPSTKERGEKNTYLLRVFKTKVKD